MDGVVNKRPCVDVVIPVFNGRDTIKAALASVLEQGNLIHRVIVIDDGSRDDTVQVVQSLCNPLIELISTPNQGVANARNLGIEKSTAEWIAFLDADDVWMLDKLNIQLAAATEHNAGFLCGSVSSHSERACTHISPQLLAKGNFVATSSVLVKRSVLQQIKPAFTPGMSFAEDYLAWLKCSTLTSGYYISTKLVDYILSENPRYRWRQILSNLFMLNLRYARFLQQIDISPLKRLSLHWALFIGSFRTALSIAKRFISASRTAKRKSLSKQ